MASSRAAYETGLVTRLPLPGCSQRGAWGRCVRSGSGRTQNGESDDEAASERRARRQVRSESERHRAAPGRLRAATRREAYLTTKRPAAAGARSDHAKATGLDMNSTQLNSHITYSIGFAGEVVLLASNSAGQPMKWPQKCGKSLRRPREPW